jgi:hypothetical protein
VGWGLVLRGNSKSTTRLLILNAWERRGFEMMASARIRREIWKKGLNELFCNRDFLVHGSRALVDEFLPEVVF